MSAPSFEGVYAAAHWLLSQNRHADAALMFRAMLRGCPHDERGWLGLGASHEGAGQHRIAVELYTAADQVVADSFRLAIARARALRVLGRDDEAAEAQTLARERASTREERDFVAQAERELASS